MSTCWQIESQSNSPTQRVRSDWGAPECSRPSFYVKGHCHLPALPDEKGICI